MDVGPYDMVEVDNDNVDQRTMGSMWCLWKPSWVGSQSRKAYLDFVGQFDQLVDANIRWTPYTTNLIHRRAPQGLSSLCLHDQGYWMTRKPLVCDIHVEEYAVHHVMRQFYLYQESPLPISHSVPDNVHRGHTAGTLWADKLVPYVESWAGALEDVVDEHRPHSDEAFIAYLQLYLPRTRTRAMHIPEEPSRLPAEVSTMYPV
ncbi:unnamed protein product [Urochloa humidicola]